MNKTRQSFLDDESISSSLDKYFTQSDNESSGVEVSESESFLSQPFYNFEVSSENSLKTSSKNSSYYDTNVKVCKNSQNNEQIGFLETDLPLLSPSSSEISSYESESEYSSYDESSSSSQSQSKENSLEHTKDSSYCSYSYGSNYMSIYLSTEA